jgi:hypothetical protein
VRKWKDFTMRTVITADVLGRATFIRTSMVAYIMSITMASTPTFGHSDPRTLSNLPEILTCLSALQSEDVQLSNSLTELLNAGAPIIISLHRLHSLTSHLHELGLDASLLLNKVSQTAETAERVGGQVRSLDDEMARVRDAGERVGQVMELKVT